MLERSGLILKFLCLGFAALVVFQFSRLLARKNPFEHLASPAPLSRPTIATNVPAEKATNSAPRPEMRSPGPPLAPAVQARIDRIIQSEILAPIIRPLPMALLGIAGRDAILRAPNGQTGLLKEGEELGGIKLIRI